MPPQAPVVAATFTAPVAPNFENDTAESSFSSDPDESIWILLIYFFCFCGDTQQRKCYNFGIE